jgi:hypothetical protein
MKMGEQFISWVVLVWVGDGKSMNLYNLERLSYKFEKHGKHSFIMRKWVY